MPATAEGPEDRVMDDDRRDWGRWHGGGGRTGISMGEENGLGPGMTSKVHDAGSRGPLSLRVARKTATGQDEGRGGI